jgi:AcrR family transcriptional regulator
MATSDTRLKILDAAEALFSSQGFAATSLRSVTGAAGVNIAAVNYHFGSKDELVSAVFARRLEPLNAKRHQLLNDAVARAKDGCPPVEAVLESLIRPAVELWGGTGGEASSIARLIGRAHSENDLHVRRLVFEQFATTTRRYCEVLARILPDIGDAELYTRFHFAIAAMASTLVDPERLGLLSDGLVDGHDMDAMVARLVAFLAGGLTAASAAIEERLNVARSPK